MRQKLLNLLLGLAIWLLAADLAIILLVLPDESKQLSIYRIIFFHVPMAWVAFLGFFAGMLASIGYLARHDLRYDAFAVSVTEVGLFFGAANLITGMIWGYIIWGIAWTWDARLTWMLVCWLMYAGYLALRHAIDEPTQRARISSVMSIFAFVNVPIVFFSIKWWRTQHPQPVVWGGGSMPKDMWNMLFLNTLPLLLLGIVFAAIRMRQEQQQREIDALRRYAHAL